MSHTYINFSPVEVAVGYRNFPETKGNRDEPRTIYRVKMEVLKEEIPSLQTQYLSHRPGRRPSWVWDTSFRDGYVGHCGHRRLIGDGFDSAKEWRSGLMSKAVKSRIEWEDVYGPCRITLVEEAYELHRCECCGPPGEMVFVRIAERVVRQFHPEPGVLDRIVEVV